MQLNRRAGLRAHQLDSPVDVAHLVGVGRILLMLLGMGLVLPTVAATAAGQGSCSSLVVLTDRDTYTVGEAVNVTVEYIHLFPSCVEVLIAHNHLIRIRILDNMNNAQYSSEHVTMGDLTIHESWSPASRGDYAIEATSWFRLAGADSSTKGIEASRSIHVQDPILVSEFNTVGLDLVAALSTMLVLVALVLVGKKKAKRETAPT